MVLALLVFHRLAQCGVLDLAHQHPGLVFEQLTKRWAAPPFVVDRPGPTATPGAS